MEEQLSSSIPVLQRHRYPRWVLIFGLLVAAVLIYSLSLLPQYATAARDLRTAEAAYKNADFDAAMGHYLSALERVPSSHVASLGAAMSIFSNTDPSDDPLGLDVLEGALLSQNEWSDLKRVMPIEYQQYFRETEQ
jgi:hypothetical protein